MSHGMTLRDILGHRNFLNIDSRACSCISLSLELSSHFSAWLLLLGKAIYFYLLFIFLGENPFLACPRKTSWSLSCCFKHLAQRTPCLSLHRISAFTPPKFQYIQAINVNYFLLASLGTVGAHKFLTGSILLPQTLEFNPLIIRLITTEHKENTFCTLLCRGF